MAICNIALICYQIILHSFSCTLQTNANIVQGLILNLALIFQALKYIQTAVTLFLIRHTNNRDDLHAIIVLTKPIHALYNGVSIKVEKILIA